MWTIGMVGSYWQSREKEEGRKKKKKRKLKEERVNKREENVVSM